MIKPVIINKFYIKQFIINNNSFQEVYENDIKPLLDTNAIIGYLFSTKENTIMSEPIKVLNIYLIKREYYLGSEITINSLNEAWKLFLIKCNEESDYKKRMLFVNPPIQQWLDTKDNWCKKMANKISHVYNWSYSEALSEVYYNVMQLYSKGTIYMGNLHYIEKSINNSVLMSIRSNKHRVNQDSGLALSMSMTVAGEDDDITLEELFEAESEDLDANIIFEDLKKSLTKLLSKKFSPREIEQLFTQPVHLLPTTLYRKLLNWRHQHSKEELYESN